MSILFLIRQILKLDRIRLDKKLIQYERALNNDDLMAAENELRLHLEKHPNDEKALCDLGLIEKNKGNIDEAMRLLQLSVKAHASYARSRFELGKFHLELKAYGLAEDYLFSAYSKNKTSEYALHLALAYKGMNDQKSAIKYLKKSIHFNQNNKASYKVLVEIYKALGKEVEVNKYELKLDEMMFVD